jgi:hypothetical protein
MFEFLWKGYIQTNTEQWKPFKICITAPNEEEAIEKFGDFVLTVNQSRVEYIDKMGEGEKLSEHVSDCIEELNHTTVYNYKGVGVEHFHLYARVKDDNGQYYLENFIQRYTKTRIPTEMKIYL